MFVGWKRAVCRVVVPAGGPRRIWGEKWVGFLWNCRGDTIWKGTRTC